MDYYNNDNYRIDDIGFGGLKLIQNPKEFCFGVDAVILAGFAARDNISFTNAVDIGTGNGIIPLIVSHKKANCHITGIDIIESNIDMAKETLKLNSLEERIEFLHLDVNDVYDKFERGSYQLVTCNPPYFPKGGGIVNSNVAKFTARQETTAQIDDFVRGAAYLLKDRGHLCMIHRPSRLVDIMHACRENHLEPKELQMVCPCTGEAPTMVLLHCIKGGGRELKVLPDLNIRDKKGEYSVNLLKLYEKFT